MTNPAKSNSPMAIEEILGLLKNESGFSSELKAFDIVLRAGVNADSNVFYQDGSTEKVREVDIVARIEKKFVSVGGEFRKSTLLLVCEVKQSDAPTVIFSSKPADPEKAAEFPSKLFYQDDDPFTVKSAPGKRYSLQLNRENARVGRVLLKILSSQERLAKNRTDENWYRGYLLGILGATDYFVGKEQDLSEVEFLFEKEPFCHVRAIPLLVIDGPLYEYFYQDGKETLNEVSFQFLRVSVPRESSKASLWNPVEHRLVMICNMAALDTVLSSLKSWVEKQAEENLRVSIDNFRRKDTWE